MQFSSNKQHSTSTGGVLWNPKTRFTNSIIVAIRNTISLTGRRCFAFLRSWWQIEGRLQVGLFGQRREWEFSPSLFAIPWTWMPIMWRKYWSWCAYLEIGRRSGSREWWQERICRCKSSCRDCKGETCWCSCRYARSHLGNSPGLWLHFGESRVFKTVPR